MATTRYPRLSRISTSSTSLNFICKINDNNDKTFLDTLLSRIQCNKMMHQVYLKICPRYETLLLYQNNYLYYFRHVVVIFFYDFVIIPSSNMEQINSIIVPFEFDQRKFDTKEILPSFWVGFSY